MTEQQEQSKILYAQAGDDVVVVHVVGRANHQLSHTVKALTDNLNRKDYSPRYIIDLHKCLCLDSTFMGTLAAMALHQTSCRKDRMVAVNTNQVTERQLTMLGLNYLLDICKTPAPAVAAEAGELQAAERVDPKSRFDQTLHMIQAHEALVDASSGNEIKFKAVLETLNKSLAREKAPSEE